MEQKKNTLNFIKTNKQKVKIIDQAIEKKEYWKALRLLYSLMQENSDSVTAELCYKLFSKLPYYVGFDDVCLKMLLSNNAEIVALGARSMIAHAKMYDIDDAKFYFNFAKNRLQNLLKNNNEISIEQILGWEIKENKFHFVDKQTIDIDALRQIDAALNSGKLDDVIYESRKLNDPIARKMAAEALIIKKDYKGALAELKSMPEDQRDIYYNCLMARLFILSKNSKELEKHIKAIESTELNSPEELIYLSEVFFVYKRPEVAIEIIEKNQQKFEFYYPMYFTKGIAHFCLKQFNEAKECFKKTYILNNRQVAAKELVYILENEKKIDFKLSIHSNFPPEIINRIEKKYKKQIELKDNEFLKLSIGQMLDMLYWVELFESEAMAEQYLLKMICCKNGIEAIKRVLLSFQTTNWLKMQCIKMLIFSGANDVDIWFTCKKRVKTIKLLLPKFMLQESEVVGNMFYSEDINYNKFLHAYATAFSVLAFENEDFEERLAEVGDCCIKSVIDEFDKQKRNKILEKYVLAILLYATCSDNLPCEFSQKKAKNSRFSSYSLLASEFEIETEELKKLAKIIFANV